MAGGVGALVYKALVVALGCDHANIICRWATFCAGVLHNVQAGTRADRGVALFQFHKTACGTEEATPVFRQGVVSETGAYACKAWAAMDVRTESPALLTDAAAAEAAQAACIGSEADTKALAEGYTNACIVETEGGFRGATCQSRACAPAAVG